jgi:hypothetical protein
MPGQVNHPFQAVIVRYSDRARDEQLNIGVVVLSPKYRFMGARFLDSWSRITSAFPGADPVLLSDIMATIAKYCEGYYSSDQLALKEPSSSIETAFDYVLPREDASIMRSEPITGIADDPERLLRELFDLYVAPPAADEHRGWRDDDDHEAAQ